jgi:hypothetical protein
MNNMTTNTTTDTTTDTKLERERPNPQLPEWVVEEVGGVYLRDMAEQAPEVLLGFSPRYCSTNSAATAFLVLDHSDRPHKK